MKDDKKSLLEMIYNDVGRPSAQWLGKTVARFFELVDLGTSLFTEKSKFRLLKRLKETEIKMKDIPEEHLCEPDPQIASRIIVRFIYLTSEQIADLFTTLLARASDSTTRGMVHPSFVGVIDSLSSDEALIIEYIKETNYRDIEFCSVQAIKRESGGFKTLGDHVTNIPSHVELLFPENTEAYMSNLLRLGILYEPQGVTQKDKTEYSKIKEIPKIVELVSDLDTSLYKGVKYKEGYYSITAFGRLFINTVLPDATKK